MSFEHDGLAMGRLRYSNSRPVKRSTAFQGIPVSVEFEPGDVIAGPGWQVKFRVPYGEIPGSKTLADGEGVDVYLGPEQQSDDVFVVHQLSQDGSYDEDKVFLGFGSARDASQAYHEHGPAWGFGGMDEMSVAEFREGYLAANRSLANARDVDLYERLKSVENEIRLLKGMQERGAKEKMLLSKLQAERANFRKAIRESK